MRRQLFSAFFVISLLTGMLGLAFNTRLGTADGGTIYIREDGSVDPPTAPVRRSGDFYTLTDNITSETDGIVIEKGHVTLDGGGYAIHGTKVRFSSGVRAGLYVTIKNLNIEGFHTGVLFDGLNNTLLECIISNNNYAVSIMWASNINLSGNVMNNNKYGLQVFGAKPERYIHSIDSSNLVNGKPVYYLLNQRDVVITPSSHPSIGYLAVVNSDNVTIEGLNIANSGQGLLVACTNNSRIIDNNLTNNDCGMCISFSFNSTISGNSVMDNLYGIWLFRSENAILSRNTVDNRYNFYIEGNTLSQYTHTIDVSNLVNGKPAYYLMNQRDLVISPETYPEIGLLELINCNNITVIGLTLACNSGDVEIAYTNNSKVIGNNLIIADVGVALRSSFNNTISGNNITTDERAFIEAGNVGIFLKGSSFNTVCRNSVANKKDGIGLFLSYNNMIFANDVVGNDHGFMFHDSSSNLIYHNNLVNNTLQVYDASYDDPSIPASNNAWDMDYPSGGNYWADYIGVDLFRGPYQNETGSDGIGDTLYVIKENNSDHYPLMDPWLIGFSETDLNRDGAVDILDIAIVARAFGTEPRDKNWNSSADLDKDGTIDILDVTMVAKDYGKKV